MLSTVFRNKKVCVKLIVVVLVIKYIICKSCISRVSIFSSVEAPIKLKYEYINLFSSLFVHMDLQHIKKSNTNEIQAVQNI